jgi:hypothetical protein
MFCQKKERKFILAKSRNDHRRQTAERRKNIEQRPPQTRRVKAERVKTGMMEDSS